MEMPSVAGIERYNFETATEILNGIKNHHFDMVERACQSRISCRINVWAMKTSEVMQNNSGLIFVNSKKVIRSMRGIS